MLAWALRVAARRLILILAVCAAYWPALSSPFLFDDQTGILDNASIRSLDTAFAPPRDTPVAGRPIVNLSLALNYAVDQLNPRGYRLVNVGIHVLVVLLMFATLRRALQLPRTPASLASHAVDISFAAALLWALHPLNTEVVNYVIERTESLMALCYLLTLYCSLRGWTIGAVLACAAGMLCKESMVTAPLMVLLIDRVLRFESAAVPNSLAALLLHVRDTTGVTPHIYFEWTEGNPVVQFLRFIAFGVGEVAPRSEEHTSELQSH